MSHTVACVQCGHALSLSEDIYERKVAGKVVTIKCKHCSGSLTVDGRGAGPVVSMAGTRPSDAPAAAPAAPKPVTSTRQTMVGVPLANVTGGVPAQPPPALDSEPPPQVAPEAAARPRAPSAPGIAAPPARPPAPSAPGVAATASAPRRPAPSAPGLGAPLPPPRRPAPSSSEVVTSAATFTPEEVPSGDIFSVAPSLPGGSLAEAAEPAPAAFNPFNAPAPASSPFAPPVAAPPASSPFAPPVAAPPVSSPFAAAPAASAPVHFAAAPSSPSLGSVPMAAPSGPVSSPDFGSPSVRDAHAEFRRGSRRPLVLVVLGIAAAAGAGLYYSSKQPAVVPTAANSATPEKRPVIGASVAPYRSDADEVVPGAAPAPIIAEKKSAPASDEPATPPNVGSSKDFANMFKAKATTQSQ